MLSIIAAIDQNRGLGKNNKLLFKIKKDLQRFKKITTGHPVVMGRKTFQSLGKTLPNRTNIIVTRNKSFRPKDTQVFDSIDKAIEFAKKKSAEIFIIGGGSIYRQTIDIADKLYLTIVKGSYDADIFFPKYKNKGFQKIYESNWLKEGNYTFKFTEYKK